MGGALVLLLAVAFRFHHLDFDLPDVQYVDGFKFAGQAGEMAASGAWRPTDLQYPSLYVYILIALYRVLGIASSYGQQLAATAVSALAGCALAAATAYAASATGGPLTVLVAGTLVAVSPTAVTEARTPSPDTLCVLFMTAAIACAARCPTKLRAWAVAGAALGLAVSAKWTGLFVAPMVGAAVIATAWHHRDARLLARATLVVAVAAILTFLGTTPFFLPLRTGYASTFANTLAIEHAGQIGRIQLGPFDYLLSRTPTWETPWLGTSLPADLGWPVVLLAAGGFGLAAVGRLGFAGALYAATVAVYLFTVSGTGYLKAIRFLLPIVPLVAALAGACAERALPTGARGRVAISLGIILLVVATPLARSLRYMGALGRPSTNALVRDWVRENITPQATVFLGPFFTDDLYEQPYRFRSLSNVGPRQYRLPPGVGLSPERNPIYGPELVDAFRQAGVEYVILNSYFDGAFTPVPENERFFPRAVAGYQAFSKHLGEEAELAHERLGWAEGRLGPDIHIWRLRAKSQ